jgi:hypothetical protein
MSKYMYLFRGDANAGLSPQQMQEHMQRWGAWIQKLSATGNFVAGDPLEASGRTVRGKRKAITDGPFAEAKDLVGGYLIVNAESLEQATELAHGCPILESDAGTVEVRALRQM